MPTTSPRAAASASERVSCVVIAAPAPSLVGFSGECEPADEANERGEGSAEPRTGAISTSSVQLTVLPPEARGDTSNHASPGGPGPRSTTRHHPGTPSAGSRHSTTCIGSSNPSRPSPVCPTNRAPTPRPDEVSTRTLVSGTHRPWAGQSVRARQVCSAEAGESTTAVKRATHRPARRPAAAEREENSPARPAPRLSRAFFMPANGTGGPSNRGPADLYAISTSLYLHLKIGVGCPASATIWPWERGICDPNHTRIAHMFVLWFKDSK